MYAQGMNIALHHVLERSKYHAVALDSALAGEGICDDPDLEVPHPTPSTRMAFMQVALVLYQNFRRCKRSHQKALNPICPFRRHGNTSLNGFTAT